jgi:hypothetical protein
MTIIRASFIDIIAHIVTTRDRSCAAALEDRLRTSLSGL